MGKRALAVVATFVVACAFAPRAVAAGCAAGVHGVAGQSGQYVLRHHAGP